MKLRPMLNPSGSSDIERLAPSKFLAPSSQPFELRFRCEPFGFRSQAVIRRLILALGQQLLAAAVCSPVCIFVLSNRSLFDFHRLRPALARSALSVSSRVGTGLATSSSPAGLRVPTDCFKHQPSYEDLKLETQARAIQDISRSRAKEFTLFGNLSKKNNPKICGFPVQK